MAHILELSQYLMQELCRNLSPILSNIIYRHSAFASYDVLPRYYGTEWVNKISLIDRQSTWHRASINLFHKNFTCVNFITANLQQFDIYIRLALHTITMHK